VTPTPTSTQQALETGSVAGMRIVQTRSSVEDGFIYYLGTATQPSTEILGSVDDCGNEFMAGAAYPSGPVALFIEPGVASISVSAGDCLVLENSAGEEMKVYLPALDASSPVTLYIGRDGATYYDSALTSTAFAAPASGGLWVDFRPTAESPQSSFYREWFYRDLGAPREDHWGSAGAVQYGW